MASSLMLDKTQHQPFLFFTPRLVTMRFHFLILAAFFTLPQLSSGEESPQTLPAKQQINKKFAAHLGALLNPARGIYRFRPLTATSDFSSVRSSGATLVYSELDLSAFREEGISIERINDIEGAFESIQQNGLKTIVRIVYSHGVDQPDASLQVIEGHLSQLRPIFDKYSYLIYAFQAGCMGAWGEWHSSTNFANHQEDRLSLLKLIAEKLPPHKSVHVRRPLFKNELISQYPQYKSRIGHHNDCLLANATDAGTYELENIKKMRLMIRNDSRTVAVGGETCQENRSFTTCDNALSLFSYLGMSYLNADYHLDVINSFKRNSCWKTIENSLGYRFSLTDIKIKLPGNSSNIVGEFTLKNDGWAPLYDEHDIVLKLKQEGEVVSEATIDAKKLSSMQASKERIFSFILPLNGTTKAQGELTIALPDSHPELKDNPLYSIRLSGKGVKWDQNLGENSILTIK